MHCFTVLKEWFWCGLQCAWGGTVSEAVVLSTLSYQEAWEMVCMAGNHIQVESLLQSQIEILTRGCDLIWQVCGGGMCLDVVLFWSECSTPSYYNACHEIWHPHYNPQCFQCRVPWNKNRQIPSSRNCWQIIATVILQQHSWFYGEGICYDWQHCPCECWRVKFCLKGLGRSFLWPWSEMFLFDIVICFLGLKFDILEFWVVVVVVVGTWWYNRTGMAGVPGTASDIFQTVKEVGANVVMISQVIW
jgi:hypothetical protein